MKAPKIGTYSQIWIYVFLPIFLLVCTHILLNSDQYLEPCTRDGDRSLITYNVELAKNFEVYNGPYSREGFSHPGPISFYYYSFFSKLFPSNNYQGAIHIAQLILNIFFLILILSILYNSGLKYLIFFLLLASFFVFQRVTPSLLFDTWNPITVIFPMMAFIFSLTALLNSKKYHYLIFASIAAAFASSNHIGCLLMLLLLSTAVLGYYLFKIKFNLDLAYFKSKAKYIILALGILLLTYCLPIYELLSEGKGSNLYKIFSYGINSTTSNSFLDSLNYIAGFYKSPLKSLVPFHRTIFLCLIVLILILLPQKNNFLKTLQNIVIAGIFISIFLATKIDNLRWQYLMWWQYGLVALSFFLLLSPFVYYILKRMRYQNSICLILLVVASTLSASFYQSKKARCSNYEQVLDYVHDNPTKYQIKIVSADKWKYAAGIALKLLKDETPFCVHDWEFMFAKKYTCNPSETNQNIVNLLIYDPKIIKNPEQTNFIHHKKFSVFIKTPNL